MCAARCRPPPMGGYALAGGSLGSRSRETVCVPRPCSAHWGAVVRGTLALWLSAALALSVPASAQPEDDPFAGIDEAEGDAEEGGGPETGAAKDIGEAPPAPPEEAPVEAEPEVVVEEPEAAPAPAPEDEGEWGPEETTARLRYELEGVEIRGNLRTTDRVVLGKIPFERGDVLDVDDPELELIRYRLLGTGFFSAVRVSLRKGSERGRVVLVIRVVERNTIIIENVAMGIAADEDAEGNSKPISPFLGLQAAETNLAGTGITLGAGFAVAADQFALQTRFADPAFLGSAWRVDAALHYITARDFFGIKQVAFESPLLEQREVTDYAVVSYKRFGGTLGAGYDLTLPLRFHFDYQLDRVEALVPNAASHVRGETREPIEIDIEPGGSVLSGIHASLTYDTRDAPFLPTRGILADLRGMVALSPLGSSYEFGRVEAGFAVWGTLPWGHVLSFDAEVGAIMGDAPFFEKFYVGDYTDLLPDRILGLSPDRRQPPNLLSTNIIEVRYGDYAAKIEGEYRIPLYQGGGAIYGIDFFTRAGLYGVAAARDLTDPPTGYSGFSQAPLDITYNLGLRVETYVGGFSVAFSNLFGLLPGQGGARK